MEAKRKSSSKAANRCQNEKIHIPLPGVAFKLTLPSTLISHHCYCLSLGLRSGQMSTITNLGWHFRGVEVGEVKSIKYFNM